MGEVQEVCLEGGGVGKVGVRELDGIDASVSITASPFYWMLSRYDDSRLEL